MRMWQKLHKLYNVSPCHQGTKNKKVIGGKGKYLIIKMYFYFEANASEICIFFNYTLNIRKKNIMERYYFLNK